MHGGEGGVGGKGEGGGGVTKLKQWQCLLSILSSDID